MFMKRLEYVLGKQYEINRLNKAKDNYYIPIIIDSEAKSSMLPEFSAIKNVKMLDFIGTMDDDKKFSEKIKLLLNALEYPDNTLL